MTTLEYTHAILGKKHNQNQNARDEERENEMETEQTL